MREFVYKEWDVTGTMGLQPTWFENADPGVGLAAAHDMLEHFPTQTSALEGECEALGSLLLLRLENGWNTRFPERDDATEMSMNVWQLLRDGMEQGLPLPRAIGSRRLDDTTEDAIVRGVEKAFSSIDEIAEDADVSEDDLAQYRDPSLPAAFAAWIRRGYRRAVRRFAAAGCDVYTVGRVLFQKITKGVDSLLRSELLAEGTRVRISAHLRSCQAVIKVFDEDTRRWVDAELYC